MVDDRSRGEGPPSAEVARARLSQMGARVLFEKTLTSSDANGAGRIVIPKVCLNIEQVYGI